MTNQPDAFFFEIQPIPDDTILYDQFQQQNIFYSYFQVEQKYYLFFYSQKSIDIDLIEQFIDILEELDTKQRKIRSLRGFFLYALEIMNNEKDLQIFKTNLKPSFWRNLRTILRQNKKEVLLRFLFGKGYSFEASNSHLEDQIQTLKSQVDSLHQKIIQLEQEAIASVKRSEQNQPLQIKKALSELLERSQAVKIGEQDNTTLKPNISSYLQENDTKIHSNLQKELSLTEQQAEETKSKSLSDASKSDFKALSDSQQYNNLSSDQSKAQNQPNFITLGKISEEEKIQIIQRGFQLQAEGKISLKKYYEGTETDSLFQLKGYRIKYEAIRKNKFYQSLKA